MSNAQKLPLALSLNRLAERRVFDVLHNTGKALPCTVVAVSNSIVTVNFEIQNAPFTLPQVTCPMFGPEYIRYPTQVGDKGVVFAADAYLGGVTGLGGGVADLAIRGNLSCLVFFPVGNSGWSSTDDANLLVLYGPDGAVMRTKDSTCKIAVTKNAAVITVPSGKSVQITSLPTSASGLPAGSLWNNSGAVRVV